MKVCSEEDFALSSKKTLPEHKLEKEINMNLSYIGKNIQYKNIAPNNLEDCNNTGKRANVKTIFIQANNEIEGLDSKFYSESLKQEKLLNMNLYKKLEDQIDLVKKNKASLDILEAIAESTMKMCMDRTDDRDIDKEKISYDQDFYIDIEKELLQLESQLQKLY